MCIIITGANGFIGSSLVKKLLNYDVKIIAVDLRFSNERVPISSKVVRVLVDSIDDEASILDAIPVDDCDVFYHFAWRGVNGIDKANPLVQIENIRTTIICASVAKKLNCKKFLCSGTIAEQSVNSLKDLSIVAGGMMYGVTKNCTHMILETYCKNIGLPFVWMQFSNIYGPSNKTGNLISYTIQELSKGMPATFGPATQPYDFIYIDDLLEAVLRLGLCDTDISFYFIGSGSPRILKSYLNEIGEIMGCSNLIRIGERSDDGIKYTFDMFDNSDLVNVIGNFVLTDFASGIKKTIESMER